MTQEALKNAQLVVDRLVLQACMLLLHDELVDLLFGDVCEVQVAEEGEQVNPEGLLVHPPGRWCAAHLYMGPSQPSQVLCCSQ